MKETAVTAVTLCLHTRRSYIVLLAVAYWSEIHRPTEHASRTRNRVWCATSGSGVMQIQPYTIM